MMDMSIRVLFKNDLDKSYVEEVVSEALFLHLDLSQMAGIIISYTDEKENSPIEETLKEMKFPYSVQMTGPGERIFLYQYILTADGDYVFFSSSGLPEEHYFPELSQPPMVEENYYKDTFF